MTLEIEKNANLGMSPKAVVRETEGRNRKVLTHRHERRKIRESLKRWDWEESE